jgi:hypothetical protein
MQTNGKAVHFSLRWLPDADPIGRRWEIFFDEKLFKPAESGTTSDLITFSAAEARRDRSASAMEPAKWTKGL